MGIIGKTVEKFKSARLKHKEKADRKKELIGQRNILRMEEDSKKHILSNKEKQNELLKYILGISIVMILISLLGCIKAFNSSGDTVTYIKELVNTYINSDKQLLSDIVNTGSGIYQAFMILKSLIVHVAVILTNVVTLAILCISRLFLIGKNSKIRNTVSKVINIIAILVLFNLILILFEINIADIITDLEATPLLALYKILGKLVDAGLFILELIFMFKYTFLVVKK